MATLIRSTRELLEVALDTWYLAHTLSSRLRGDNEMEKILSDFLPWALTCRMQSEYKLSQIMSTQKLCMHSMGGVIS